jgi:hypothetical protein
MRYSRDWYWLEMSGQKPKADTTQLNLVMMIWDKLLEYSGP